MKKLFFLIYKKTYNLLAGKKLGRLWPIKIINNFLYPLLKPKATYVQGHKMYLDKKDALELSVRVYEPLQVNFVKKTVKEGDTVLDLGAHIGYYTLLFAKLVGNEGKVFSFEPNPENFSLLKKNVKENGYNNVEIFQKAVSGKTGKTKLYISEVSPGSRIYDSNEDQKTMEIETVCLDDYFKDYDKKISFIKMDVEGAEGETVKGIVSILNKNEDIKIMTEFWPEGLKRSGVEAEDYLKFMTDKGFRIYYINQEEKKIEPISIPDLLKITPGKQMAADLIFSKKEISC